MNGTGILPDPDIDSAPYWEALGDGRFEIQHCADCGNWTWPPRPICSGCHGENMRWDAVSGVGEVHGWVVTHQVYAPSLAPLVPYTIVLARIAEQDDILIPGRFMSDMQVYQGMPLRAVPTNVGGGLGVLEWKAAPAP